MAWICLLLNVLEESLRVGRPRPPVSLHTAADEIVLHQGELAARDIALALDGALTMLRAHRHIEPMYLVENC